MLLFRSTLKFTYKLISLNLRVNSGLIMDTYEVTGSFGFRGITFF